MTAASYYFQVAANDYLPAVVLIRDGELCGIATVAFDVHASGAEEMAFSRDLDDRATAAIFACYAAYNTALHVIPMA